MKKRIADIIAYIKDDLTLNIIDSGEAAYKNFNNGYDIEIFWARLGGKGAYRMYLWEHKAHIIEQHEIVTLEELKQVYLDIKHRYEKIQKKQ